MIICYTVPEIWRVTDVIVIFHFGLFLHFYPPNSLKNQNFKKMKRKKKKKILEISSFYTYVYPKLWSDNVRFLRCGAPQTDGRMDGRTEKVTLEVGFPPKNIEKTLFVSAGAQRRWKTASYGNALLQYLPHPESKFPVKFIFT